MLRPWLSQPSAKSLVAELSEVAKTDLVAVAANASDLKLKETAIAQPLLLATALLSWHTFQQLNNQTMDSGILAVAGHSAGEFAASVVAGVLAPSDAMSLIKTRGEAMAAACEEPKTGMAAVLGGDESEVIEAIEQGGLFVANKNATGHIVAAGLIDRLEKLRSNLPSGCRARSLPVAGAFHTKYMQSAVERFAEAAQSIEFRDPRLRFVSNNEGVQLTTGQDVREHLTSQIARQVDWVSCQKKFVTLGATQAIELAPGNTLSAIAKRQIPNITSHPITSLMP
jgi:[acyl-carrier-protein] S-malonyltransferase